MSDSSNITLQRYEDGTPSVLRKKTVYTDLYFFRKSDVLVQLTKVFCERFLPKYGDRTVDQMVQAARSIKQNIAEGFTDGQTSFETEIKLLGIAKGSNQELLEDYQDYLKRQKISDWAVCASRASNASMSSMSSETSNSSMSSMSRNSSMARDSSKARDSFLAARYDKLLAFCRAHNDLSDYEKFFSLWTDEELANTAICLCHMVDRMLASFIAKRDREFVEEGGVRERMTAARLDKRGTQKEIIAQQAAEIDRLKAKVASLEREIAGLKGQS